MKYWSQWALIMATILPFAGVLVYHAHVRFNRSPILKASSVVSEADPSLPEIISRIDAKRRVANEVIAGRLSLLQAAAAFRNLDERWPCNVIPWAYFPNAASEDEVYCLLVIGYVRCEAPPERADELTKRLQAELAAMLRDGTLHLPDAEDASTADIPTPPVELLP
jgi:hypothetical protein